MKRILTLLLGIFIATWAHSITVYYQPTPYPLKKMDGTTMQQGINIVHIWDGWLTSFTGANSWMSNASIDTYAATFDTRRAFIKFDLTGLPSNVNSAALWLMPGTASSPAPYIDAWRIDAAWDKSTVTWNSQPAATKLGWLPPVQVGSWWGQNITAQYQAWKSAPTTNNGMRFDLYWPGDYWTTFRSSRYADFATDPYADGKRPMLQLDFTPTIELKMPLPGNLSWLATTEVGGYDCKGSYDQYHDSTNWFSIDFSWRTQNLYYANPDPTGNRQNNGVYIPVIAANGGKILSGANYYNNSDPNHPNGYFVSVDHDGDGNPFTGIQTRYIHLQPPGPVVSPGNTIAQGALLGYMGNTGLSNGAHLHFGIRYNDNGASTVSELTKVVMEGKLLKSYQTECAVTNGVPTDWIRYYPSTNTP